MATQDSVNQDGFLGLSRLYMVYTHNPKSQWFRATGAYFHFCWVLTAIDSSYLCFDLCSRSKSYLGYAILVTKRKITEANPYCVKGCFAVCHTISIHFPSPKAPYANAVSQHCGTYIQRGQPLWAGDCRQIVNVL